MKVPFRCDMSSCTLRSQTLQYASSARTAKGSSICTPAKNSHSCCKPYGPFISIDWGPFYVYLCRTLLVDLYWSSHQPGMAGTDVKFLPSTLSVFLFGTETISLIETRLVSRDARATRPPVEKLLLQGVEGFFQTPCMVLKPYPLSGVSVILSCAAFDEAIFSAVHGWLAYNCT